MDTDFLDWALADFSGYVAADARYDGPFCSLSAIDNRRYKRLLYDVLDHDPTHDDIRAFLGRLHTALVARGLTLCGVTTDGSARSPAPLREVFGKVRHHICQLHIVAAVVQAVGGGGGQRPQGPGSHTTQTAQRPAEHASREGGGPHQKAARRARRRVVHPSVSVWPTAPAQHRTQDPGAHQPWMAPVTRAAGRHGTGVGIMRSALSDPDRSGQIGQTAASAPVVPTGGRHPQKALCPYLGKGPDVS
jgi:hypothetical protein